MRILKENTATRVTVGPFLDKTDGITPEIALTVTSCLLTFTVDDAGVPTLVIDAAPTASGGSNDMVHITSDAAGFYDLELTAAQTNYTGRAIMAITDVATHLPVFHEFQIVSANVYDSIFTDGDVLDTNVTQLLGTAWLSPAVAGTPDVNAIEISGDATAANNAEAFFDGTGYAGTNNVIPTVTTTTTATNVTNNVTAVLADDAGHGGASSAITLSNYSNFQGAASPHPEILQTTTIATLASQTSFTLTAGSADDDAYNGCLAVVEDVSTSTQKCIGVISDYTGATKTVTLAADPGVFTMAATDNIDIIAQQAMRGTDSAATVGAEMGLADGAITAAKFGAGAIDATALGDASITAAKIATDAVDADALATDAVTEIQSGLATEAKQDIIDTNVDQIETAVITNAAGVDIAADIIAVKAETATIVADTNELQTDWTDAGRLDAILDLILADTAELQADWANAGRLDAILDIIAADTTTDIPGTITTLQNAVTAVKAITDAIGATAAANMALALGAAGIVTGTAQTGTLSATQMSTDLSEATDDHYIGRVIVWTSGALLGQAAAITDYTGTGGICDFATVTDIPSNGDTFIIV